MTTQNIPPLPMPIVQSPQFIIRPELGQHMLRGELYDKAISHKLDHAAMVPGTFQTVRDDLARFCPVPVTRVAMHFLDHAYSGIIDSDGTPYFFALNSRGLMLKKAPETEEVWETFQTLRDVEDSENLAKRRVEASKPALVIKAEKWTSAGAIVVDGKGRIALVKPKGGFGGHEWTFPKGRVESGETLEQAAVQEVAEEAGLHCKLGEKIGEFPGSYSNTHYYMAELTDHAHDKMDAESSEVRWVTPDEAGKLLTHPRDAKVLEGAKAQMAKHETSSGSVKPWGHVAYYRSRGGQVQFIKQKGTKPVDISPKVPITGIESEEPLSGQAQLDAMNAKLHEGEKKPKAKKEKVAEPAPEKQAKAGSKITLQEGKKDSETKQGVAAFDKTLEAIASVFDFHGANGDLTVSLNGNVSASAYAQYSPLKKLIAVKTTPGNYWNSFAHEFGHYIDHKLIEKNGGGATLANGGKRPKAVAAFIEKLKQYPGHKKLIENFPGKAEYHSMNTEVFARFFNEWMFTRLKAAGLAEPPAVPVKISYRSKDKVEWMDHADFDALCSEFDQLLTSEGIDWHPVDGGLKQPKKTGEGSKGGVVVGHDKHGDPIYQSQIKDKKPTTGYTVDPDKKGGGSQGGKWVVDENGQHWFAKHYSNEERMHMEHLACQLYDKLGVHAPTTKLDYIDGKLHLLSKEVKGTVAKNAIDCDDVKYDFAFDAWLGNWDVVGTGYDNILVNEHGVPYRIDNGGALLYGAMGGKKGEGDKDSFGQQVIELETMRSSKKNKYAAAVFGQLTDEQVAEQIEQRFSDDHSMDVINTLDEVLTPSGLAESVKKELRLTLLQRMKYMREWAKKKTTPAKKEEPALVVALPAVKPKSELGAAFGFLGVTSAKELKKEIEGDVEIVLPKKAKKKEEPKAAAPAAPPPSDSASQLETGYTPQMLTSVTGAEVHVDHPYGQPGKMVQTNFGMVYYDPAEPKAFELPGQHEIAASNPHPEWPVASAFWDALNKKQPKTHGEVTAIIGAALKDLAEAEGGEYEHDDAFNKDVEDAILWLKQEDVIVNAAVKPYPKPSWWNAKADSKFGDWIPEFGPLVDSFDNPNEFPPPIKHPEGGYDSWSHLKPKFQAIREKAAHKDSPYTDADLGSKWAKHDYTSTSDKMMQKKHGGLNKHEALYAGAAIKSWVGWPSKWHACHLRGVFTRIMGIDPHKELAVIKISAKSDGTWSQANEDNFWAGYKGTEPPPNKLVGDAIAKLAKAAQKAHQVDCDADGNITLYRCVPKDIFDEKTGRVKHGALASWTTNPTLNFGGVSSSRVRLTIKVPLKTVIFGWRGTPGTLGSGESGGGEDEVWVAASGDLKVHSYQTTTHSYSEKNEKKVKHDD